MNELVAAVAIPALITGGWTFVGLRVHDSGAVGLGAAVAAGSAAVLVLIAAFLPFVGSLGALAVPVLCVAAAYALMRIFSRPYAVALAMSIPFAILMGLRPPLFPFLLPIVLVIPLWMVSWVESEQRTARVALTLLAALVAVPIAVFGLFFLLRGSA